MTASLLERYPIINEILWFPSQFIASGIFALGLAPAGDAGFVIYPVSMVLQWTMLGFLGGICRAWWLKRVATRWKLGASPFVPIANGAVQRILTFGKTHLLLMGALGVLVIVIGYVASQEIVLARDRDFFLRHVDHKAVAEACFSILSKPEAERWQSVALYIGDDPRLPEAIRALKPKAVSIHINEISITKTPRHFYNRLTFRQNQTDTNRFDLVYEEGPSSSRKTCVCTISAQAMLSGNR